MKLFLGIIVVIGLNLFNVSCSKCSHCVVKDTNGKVFPNPSKGNFTLASATLMNNIRIFNELGMLVKEIIDVNNYSVELVTTFEKGVYFVYATTEVGANVQKLIIE
jgi:hypothetical protein